MSVLLGLTLFYIVILVLVLAIGLSAIVYFLHGARANLAHIARGLQHVDTYVESLHPALTAMNDGLAALLANLQRVHAPLTRAEAVLEEEHRAS